MRNKLFTLLLIPATFLLWSCTAANDPVPLEGSDSNVTTGPGNLGEPGDPNDPGDSDSPESDPPKIDLPQIPGKADEPDSKFGGALKATEAKILIKHPVFQKAHEAYAQKILGKWATPEKLPGVIQKINYIWKEVYGSEPSGLPGVQTTFDLNSTESINKFFLFVMRVEVEFKNPIYTYGIKLGESNAEAFPIFLKIKNLMHTQEDMERVGSLAEGFNQMGEAGLKIREHLIEVMKIYGFDLPIYLNAKAEEHCIEFTDKIIKKIDSAAPEHMAKKPLFIENRKSLRLEAVNACLQMVFVRPDERVISFFQFPSNELQFAHKQYPLILFGYHTGKYDYRGTFGAFDFMEQFKNGEGQVVSELPRIVFYDPSNPDN